MDQFFLPKVVLLLALVVLTISLALAAKSECYPARRSQLWTVAIMEAAIVISFTLILVREYWR